METKRILLIDDEADLREVAQVSLEMMAGWEVLTASSGREGQEMAAAYLPDAILLDVMMPDMDGPSTFLALRERPETREIPVILLTAKVQLTERRRFLSLGLNAVLAKPFDPLTLADQIKIALGWEP